MCTRFRLFVSQGKYCGLLFHSFPFASYIPGGTMPSVPFTLNQAQTWHLVTLGHQSISLCLCSLLIMKFALGEFSQTNQ